MDESQSFWRERNGRSEPRPRLHRHSDLLPAHADEVLNAPAGMWEAEPDSGGGGMDLRALSGYLAALWRWKILIVLMAAGGALAGLVVLLFEPVVYPARATLEVQGLNENFMNASSIDPQAGAGNYSPNDANIQTQIRILESQSLKRRVMRKLEREMTPVRAPQDSWNSRLRVRLRIATSDPLAETRQALQQALLSARGMAVRPTRIIEIRCESSIPDVAAMYANTLATEFIDQTMESRLKSAQQTSRWLLNQLEETKAKLENAETRLRDHSRGSGLMFIEQDTLTASKLRQLQADLASIQGDRIAKQSRYEMTRSTPPEALPEVLNDSTLRDYQAQLTDLRKEMAQLTLTLTPEHYKVKRLEAQVAELEDALKKSRAAILKRIEGDYRAALSQERMLSNAYAGQSRVMIAQSDKTNEYQTLKREVEVTQQLYNALLQQANQAGLAAAVPTNHVQVIDPATPASSPSRPVPSQRISLGFAAGLALGCALAMMRQMHDRTVRSPGLSDYLKITELGVIPSLETPKRSHHPALALESGMEKRVELVTWEQKPSMLAESFRAALAPILLDRHSQPQVIVLTSPGPSEGKTTVASNMAIAMTEASRRILLIDMDLRKPRLHEVFTLRNDRGASDVLQASTALVDYPFELVIQQTAVPGLSVMTSGPTPESTMRLLYSQRLLEMIHVLRRRFDAILIDTPPMLRFPDARIIARLSEGVVLVLRSGQTGRDAAMLARQKFEADGTRIIGAILNDWDLSSPQAKYYAGPPYYAYPQTSYEETKDNG